MSYFLKDGVNTNEVFNYMKILFVCVEYCGNRDASSQCIQNLRNELKRANIGSDVLTYDWTGETEKEAFDNAGKIYSAKTWYRYARINRSGTGKIQMSIKQWVLVLLVRGISILLEGKDYIERGFPIAATRCIAARLTQLYQLNKYDWIVSCSWPFVNHKTVVKTCASLTKCALLNFDPYWNNQACDPCKQHKRAKEEAVIYERADAVFCMPEQISDYQNKEFDRVRYKIIPMQYPNFCKLNSKQNSCIRFDKNNINLLYLGTLYRNSRNPDILFEIVEQTISKEPNIHLHIIGKTNCNSADYSERLQQNLTFYPPVAEEETADLLNQADVLVNLGNVMQNQMPSKIIKYIASGKAILNISAVKTCNTLPLLKRYPRCFQVFSDEIFSEEFCKNFIQFCYDARKETLEWEYLSQLYPELCAENVAREFCEVLLGKNK